MDFQMQRRPGVAKYGKNKGRVAGYNFYADAKPGANAPASTSQYPISPSSASSEFSSHKDDHVPLEKAIKPAHVTTHSQSSFSSSTSPRSPSPTLAQAGPSTFDITSSGDERNMNGDRPQKRRKITQAFRESKPQPIENEKPALQSDPQPRRLPLAKKGRNVPGSPRAAGNDSAAIKPRNKSGLPTQVSRHDEPEPAAGTYRGKVKTKTRLKKTGYSKTPREDLTRHEDPVDDFDIPLDDADMPLQPTRKTRTLVKTKTGDAQTPRKQQWHLTDSDAASVASPGSIGLGELRLTPEPSPTRHRSLSPAPSAASTPGRRARLRRIDMLDVPKEPTSKPMTRESSTGLEAASSQARAVEPAAEHSSNSDALIPSLTRAGSSQTRQGYGKARNTYGKERSHLADMVDDFGHLSQDASQEATYKLATQLAVQSTSSRLHDELELEGTSSDDIVAGTKIKSIHELRQAGSNDRLHRDLEGLLADIDPNSRTTSKSLRLSACIKLFRKTSQHAFASIVAQRGLDRLAEWSLATADNTSKLIFNMIFWRLTHNQNASPANLRSIVLAVASSSSLITNLEPMSNMIRNRRENHSKQSIKDLQTFEDIVLRDKLLPAYEGGHIIPATVTLGALNDSLRKLVESGLTNISLGKDSYKKMLFELLPFACQPSGQDIVQDKFVIKLVLSLLQIFTGPLGEDFDLTEQELITLGNTLGDLMERATNVHEDLVQAVLHFTISLSDDRAAICQHLASSILSSSPMSVCNARFLALVDAADSAAEIDPDMHNSIILSLACLINLTEHDAAVRVDFAQERLDMSSTDHLGKLVEIYVQAAPRLVNALTAEKTQMLIALGYLSVLISGLCLEESIRTETIRLLGKFALSDVVASAKEFLIHLQTLELAQRQLASTADGDADTSLALGGLSQRWGAIVAAVKVP